MIDFIVFGQSTDPHVSTVINHFPDQAVVKILDVYALNDQTINLEDDRNFKSFVSWGRIKPNFDEEPAFRFDDFRRESFFYANWGAFARGVELNGVQRPLHKPSSAVRANNKVVQLHLARELGFNTPKSMFTNNINDVLGFLDSDKILVKVLTGASLRDDKLLFSSLVTREFLENQRDEAAYVPHIFQEYVDKKYELRVNVIDSEVFALRIDSQASEVSRIDWRKGGLGPEHYRQVSIPTALSNKLIEYLKRLQVEWGAFDLIVDKNDNYVFLECNIDGQWYNKELELSDEISASMARMFTKNINEVREKNGLVAF